MEWDSYYLPGIHAAVEETGWRWETMSPQAMMELSGHGGLHVLQVQICGR